jgi:DNA repair protein RadC
MSDDPHNTPPLFPEIRSLSKAQRATLRRALRLLESQLTQTEAFTNPVTVKQYCQLQIGLERDEHFCALFLNTRHQLISFERLFRGTVDGASVYPRVVVRRCLELNASAVIFTHNHPSGIAEPSRDDAAITRRLKDALALIDVRVLDHIVVGIAETTSMAEQGLL